MELSDYHSLYTFTKLNLQSVRRSARSGAKDEARNFLRYVRSARIVEILRPIQWPDGLQCDVALLEYELRELADECHPSTASDRSNDIADIRTNLNFIAAGVARLLGSNPISQPETPTVASVQGVQQEP